MHTAATGEGNVQAGASSSESSDGIDGDDDGVDADGDGDVDGTVSDEPVDVFDPNDLQTVEDDEGDEGI